MVALLVIAIVVGLAAPAVGQFIESNRLISTTNTLLADLGLARSEAVKRQDGQVVICTSTSGSDCNGSAPWSAGWVVFWDKNSSNSFTAGEDVLLKVQGPLPASLSTATTPASTSLIAYTRLGTQSTAIESLEVENTELAAKRVICINAIGRASLLESNVCA